MNCVASTKHTLNKNTHTTLIILPTYIELHIGNIFGYKISIIKLLPVKLVSIR